MEEVAGFTLTRSLGEVAFSWETSEPTASQVYLQWSLSGKPTGEPILVEDTEPGLHHDPLSSLPRSHGVGLHCLIR